MFLPCDVPPRNLQFAQLFVQPCCVVALVGTQRQIHFRYDPLPYPQGSVTLRRAGRERDFGATASGCVSGMCSSTDRWLNMTFWVASVLRIGSKGEIYPDYTSHTSATQLTERQLLLRFRKISEIFGEGIYQGFFTLFRQTGPWQALFFAAKHLDH
jgi:hypothetical protein